MKTGFLYAGQGSQHPGMGAHMYETYPAFRAVFDSVEAGFDLKKVCFADPEHVLDRTRYTQPCMVAFAAGMTAVLGQKGIVPDMVAGLSLGEYSALHAAGVFSAKTAVSLAAFRGHAMEEAARGTESAMTAVIGLKREDLEAVCREASIWGVVAVTNENCPGQTVIGGQKEAVLHAARLAKERGAKRCVPLKVSGPFHTSLMAPAGEALRHRFAEIGFADPSVPVIFNCLGDVMGREDSIPALLVRQVQSGVRMEECIRKMVSMGAERIIEIGPGRVLSGFVRRIAPDILLDGAETAEDVEALAGA